MLIPKQRYLSAAWRKREWERMWTRVWLLAGLASDVARTGDRFTFELGDQSILIVRDGGGVRAFHNVCPHRGNRLCDGPGSGEAIRCGWHGWRFGLDGALRDANGAGVAAKGAALAPVRCESFAGFVWISLAPRGPDLRAYLGPAAEQLAARGFERWSVRQDVTLDLACNWKTSVDAHNEIYHLRTLHPDVAPVIDAAGVKDLALGRHAGMTIPFSGGRGGNEFIYLFPNVQLNMYEAELMLLRHRPHPVDPEAASFDQLVLSPAGSGHERPRHRRGRPGEISLGPVTDADVRIVEEVQRGMRSSGFAKLRIGPEEACIAHMHRELDRYLKRGR